MPQFDSNPPFSPENRAARKRSMSSYEPHRDASSDLRRSVSEERKRSSSPVSYGPLKEGHVPKSVIEERERRRVADAKLGKSGKKRRSSYKPKNFFEKLIDQLRELLGLRTIKKKQPGKGQRRGSEKGKPQGNRGNRNNRGKGKQQEGKGGRPHRNQEQNQSGDGSDGSGKKRRRRRSNRSKGDNNSQGNPDNQQQSNNKPRSDANKPRQRSQSSSNQHPKDPGGQSDGGGDGVTRKKRRRRNRSGGSGGAASGGSAGPGRDD